MGSTKRDHTNDVQSTMQIDYASPSGVIMQDQLRQDPGLTE